MMHLKEDFKAGTPVSAIGADWFNTVARFLNRLIGVKGIRVNRESDWPTISIDFSGGGGGGGGGSSTLDPDPTTGVHISEDDIGTPAPRDIPAWAAPDYITGLDNETPAGWERGKTAFRNGAAVDSSHPAVGCSMTVCTHAAERVVGGSQCYEYLFARLDFDENGMLIRAVPCDHWFKTAPIV